MLAHPLAPSDPTIESRVFHQERMGGWLGYVRLADIEYWTENRRTDIQIDRLQASTLLSNDQIVDLLLMDPDLDIKSLAQNILLNELRQPLVISYDRELLDGNRRYLAHKWIEQNGTPQDRERFSVVKAWVLSKEHSIPRNKTRIVTEYNFLYDFKQDWSDFVKAKLLHDEYYGKSNYTYNDLYDLYGGSGFSKHKITEFIKTYEIISDFLEVYQGDEQALDVAAENFIWFQQLQRSVRDEIRNDDELQEAVFRNIRNGDVTKTDDLKNLKGIRGLREAWKLFRDGDPVSAQLKYKVWEHEQKQSTEPDRLMDEIISRLARILDNDGFVDRVSYENKAKFHSLAQKVPGQAEDVVARLENALKVFEDLTSVELEAIPNTHITRISNTLARTAKQASAT